MKVIHVHHDGGADAASMLTIDPNAVDGLDEAVPPRVMAGIVARWDAVANGECSCGAETIRLNRRKRRELRANFEEFIQHCEGCPAMEGAVRTWHYLHRSMSR